MPQQLSLLEDLAPPPQVWERLTDEQRATVIDTMARVIRHAALPMAPAATDTDTPEKPHA